LEYREVSNRAEAPIVRFEASDEVGALQFREQGRDVEIVRREYPHPQHDGLPLEHALVVALVPDPNEQQARDRTDRDDQFVSPESRMNAADAGHQMGGGSRGSK
jgi:hypothetical protein